MSTPSRIDTPIVPFNNAKDEEGNFLPGYATTEHVLNTRLALMYQESDDLCCIAVTDLNKGEGHHIWLTTDTLRELIDQFADMVETTLELKDPN